MLACNYGVLVLSLLCAVHCTSRSEEDESGTDDSSEHLGASVTTVARHPYAATLLNRDVYNCSAVILNEYWLVTSSKCFSDELTKLYATQRNLKNFTIRVGSNFNNKEGNTYRVIKLINNFDLKVSAIKIDGPIVTGESVGPVHLPNPDAEPVLGSSATMLAWTPSGHIRVVSAPVIDPFLCEAFTRLVPGHFVCMGGVQDLNPNWCRKDDGGAIIQNNTLVALTSFYHECAQYSRPHAFPKASSFSHWLDTIIWDESERPTTTSTTTAAPITTVDPKKGKTTADKLVPTTSEPYEDNSNYMLTLPYDPINVPLEPNGENSVLPRLSMYEAYLKSFEKSNTQKPVATTRNPSLMDVEDRKRAWLEKINKALLMMPAPEYTAMKEAEMYDYKSDGN